VCCGTVIVVLCWGLWYWLHYVLLTGATSTDPHAASVAVAVPPSTANIHKAQYTPSCEEPPQPPCSRRHNLQLPQLWLVRTSPPSSLRGCGY